VLRAAFTLDDLVIAQDYRELPIPAGKPDKGCEVVSQRLSPGWMSEADDEGAAYV